MESPRQGTAVRADDFVLKQSGHTRLIWLDVARVIACFLIIANHTAFYTGEIYRIIWAQFLASRTSFFMIAAGYFVGTQQIAKLKGKLPWFIGSRSFFLLKPYLLWSLVSIVAIGWSSYNENYAQYQNFYLCLQGRADIGDGLMAFLAMLGIGGHPADAPMWFLRDIIIYTAVAPLFVRLKHFLLPCGILAILLMSCISEVTFHSYPSMISLGFFLIGLWLSRFSLHSLTRCIEPYSWLWLILCLLLTPYIIIYREAYQIWMLPVGVMGIIASSLLLTNHFPGLAKRMASWAPSCFFVFATHYLIIILLRESGCITLKGWAWDLLWLALIPIIYAFLTLLFFFLVRKRPQWIPWIGAYTIKGPERS